MRRSRRFPVPAVQLRDRGASPSQRGFGAYFTIFMVYRAMKPQEFLAPQQHLNINIEVLNTLVLLASSWFIARSVHAARTGEHSAALRLTYLGGLCGVAFTAIKAYEWSTEVAQGHTISRNGFFMFYYMLTGVYLFQVLLGLLILGVVARELRNPAASTDVHG